MDDTSPEIELLLKARFASMTGSERAFMALQMFETAREIVLSALMNFKWVVQHEG